MSCSEEVFRYLPSDDTESFVWIIIWITSMISPEASASYPSANKLNDLVCYKMDVLRQAKPLGSFHPIINEMIGTLQSKAGEDLRMLTMEQVRQSAVRFEEHVLEHDIS
jgi:hypothetical protein